MSSRIISGVVVLVFLAAGIIGHDPWKPDEAYTFGLVMHVLESGDWVVPTLAGEPFMEKPPLYFVVAALLARAFSPVLAIHDGARVATFAFMSIGITATAWASRRVMGPGHGSRAALLVAGSLGIVLHAHEMVTDTALFAGFALAALGLSYAREKPCRSGAWLGTGVGIGFLSKGLVEPAIMGLACVLLPAVAADWRSRRYAASLAWATLFALPWLVVWPLALQARDPVLFDTWFWANNFGRYFGSVRLGASSEPWFYAKTLPWFCLPSGVLAAWTAWRAWQPRDPLAIAPALMPVVMTVAMLLALCTSAAARDIYAMPLLIPLAILGSASVTKVPERWGTAASMTIGCIAAILVGLAWVVWTAEVTGAFTATPTLLLRWLPDGFHFGMRPVVASIASVATLSWLALWLYVRAEWLVLWTASVAAAWCVWMTLMLPWIDHAKSFRAPFEAMALELTGEHCVQSLGLGEPQRAMLHYYLGLKTQRGEVASVNCPYLLVQSDRNGRFPQPNADWRLRWEGERPGERFERFRLWERENSEIATNRAFKSGNARARLKRRVGRIVVAMGCLPQAGHAHIPNCRELPAQWN